jgi:arylsulfatase A-like enzyme
MPGPKYHDRIPVAPPPPTTLFDDYEGRTPEAAKHRMGMEHLIPHYDLKVPLNGKTVFDRNRMTVEQGRIWDAAYAEENAAYLANPPQGREKMLWNYRRYITDYLKCVAAVDDGVGRVLEELEALGLAENTLVVYSSDQGFFLGDHGWFDKRWMYEESFKMPLLMRWPQRIAPGTKVDLLTQNIDFAPTFLEVAGLPVAEEMQGKSLLPLLEGKEVPWRDALYYEYHDHIGEHRVARHYGIRTDRYKLIHYPETNDWELFDLQEDPEELRSVADDPAYAELRASLERRLHELRVGYQVPGADAD